MPPTNPASPQRPTHSDSELSSVPAPLPATSHADAMALIPAGTFVLTSSYAETRGGVIVRWVQAVSATPPLVVVAIEKGQPLSPVIRDSRRFGLCQLAPEDRVLRRLFEPESSESGRSSNSRIDPVDPFLGLPTKTTANGVPILLKSLAWLECELTRHLDVEGNCELYIGLVHAGGVLRAPVAAVSDQPAPQPNGTSSLRAANAPSTTGTGFGRLDRHPTRANKPSESGNGNGTRHGATNGKREATKPTGPKRRGS